MRRLKYYAKILAYPVVLFSLAWNFMPKPPEGPKIINPQLIRVRPTVRQHRDKVRYSRKLPWYNLDSKDQS